MTALLENLEALHQSCRNFRGGKAPPIIYFTGAGASLALLAPSQPPLLVNDTLARCSVAKNTLLRKIRCGRRRFASFAQMHSAYLVIWAETSAYTSVNNE